MAGGIAAAGLSTMLAGCQTKARPGGLTLVTPLSPGDLGAGSSVDKSGAVAEGPYVDELGRGVDTVFDEGKRYFVTGELVRSSVLPEGVTNANELKYQLIENQQDYHSLIRRSAKAKGRWKIFSGGASGSSRTEARSNSYSLHVCAVARRYDAAHYLKNGTVRLTEDGETFIRSIARDRGRLLRSLGDMYVAGVQPMAELIVDIRFETSSSSNRRRCSASVSAGVSGLVSGSGSFKQLIDNASAYKRVTVEISGLTADQTPHAFTANEATELVRSFLSRTDGAANTAWTSTRDVGDLTLRRGLMPEWVNFTERMRREQFVATGESSMDYLIDARADAEYVAANPVEFDGATRDRAAQDLIAISQTMDRIAALGNAAHAHFRDTGQNGSMFDPAPLKDGLPDFDDYVQIEPTPPAKKKRKPRQPVERDRARPEPGGLH